MPPLPRSRGHDAAIERQGLNVFPGDVLRQLPCCLFALRKDDRPCGRLDRRTEPIGNPPVANERVPPISSRSRGGTIAKCAYWVLVAAATMPLPPLAYQKSSASICQT
jgi:hypothetical protein